MACGGYPLLSSITLYLPFYLTLHLCISASRISGDIRPLILADTAVPVR